MGDYTPQDLKRWIEEVLDPDTSTAELRKTVTTLAHTRDPEALRALEELRSSARAAEVEGLGRAIDGCVTELLFPANKNEEKDYIRVKLWQRYEKELFDLEDKRDAAEVRKKQLEVEKEFLQSALELAESSEQELAVMGRLSGIDSEIALAENELLNVNLEIEGQQFLVHQIEKAIQSPVYRRYGKERIGVTLCCEWDQWLEEDGDV